MFVVMGIFIYFSWFFFGYPFLDWTEYYLELDIYPVWLTTLLYTVEILVFILGMSLFLIGVFSFITQKKAMKTSNSNGIICKGIYRFIRHPQNLGICLMLLPFALILPFESAPDTIRFGDILSWGLSSYFISLISLWEEKAMLKTYPELYWVYLHQTGFFFPKWRNFNESAAYSDPLMKKYLKRRFLKNSLFYIGFLVGCVGLFYLLKPFMEKIKFPPVWTNFFSISDIIEYLGFWHEFLRPFIVLISIWIFSFFYILIRCIYNSKKHKSLNKMKQDIEK